METLRAIMKDKPARDCMVYLGTAAVALGLWVFHQDHLALGMVILSTCWAWAPAVFLTNTG